MRKHLVESYNQSGYEPDDIEVTPEMVDAGLRALRGTSAVSWDDETSLVTRIYRAMTRARRA